MTNCVSHKKCFTKKLDGTWTWEAPVWLTKCGMFANCVIKSPEGRTFPSMNKAYKDMVAVLTTMGVIKRRRKV